MPQRPKRWSATARTDEGLRQMFLAACLCTRSKLNKAPQLACSALRWQHTSTPGYVPVVVVGAGPTGLVLSCLLSQYGMRPATHSCSSCAVHTVSGSFLCDRCSAHDPGAVQAADAASTGTLHQQSDHGGKCLSHKRAHGRAESSLA